MSDLMKFFVASFEKLSRINSNQLNGGNNNNNDGPIFETVPMD
ncbi:unnamed protein product, partial [Rotaria magnacalcarata]